MCLGMRRNVQVLNITNALALSCSKHPRVLLISQKPISDALLCDVSVGSKPSDSRCPRHVRLASNSGRPDISVKSTLWADSVE
jgi:hypothetical protein